MKRKQTGAAKKSFTLVELLVVVSVIAALAGITVGVLPIINKKTSDAKTLGIVKSLEVALNSYKAKYGFYPPSKDGKANYFYLDVVNENAATASNENVLNNFCQFIDYSKLKKDSLGKGTAADRYIPMDGYGNPIIYRCPGYFNRGMYDIGSTGSDLKFGLDGKENAAASAPANIPEENTYQKNFGKGDDITNFKR